MNIIITGASKGVGYALIKSFLLNSGNKVFAISRTSQSLENLVKDCNSGKLSGTLFYLGFDLLSGEYNKLIKEIELKLGNVDVLINNAGAMINKPFENLTDEDFDHIYQVNVKGPFKLIRDLKPLFNKPAHIVNMTSMGGFQGSVKFPGLSLYSASKGSLAVLTECLAEEFNGDLIKVNALALGAVQTKMLSDAFPGYEAPLSSEEIAEFIKDFAMKGHKYFNGKILPVSVSTP